MCSECVTRQGSGGAFQKYWPTITGWTWESSVRSKASTAGYVYLFSCVLSNTTQILYTNTLAVYFRGVFAYILQRYRILVGTRVIAHQYICDTRMCWWVYDWKATLWPLAWVHHHLCMHALCIMFAISASHYSSTQNKVNIYKIIDLRCSFGQQYSLFLAQRRPLTHALRTIQMLVAKQTQNLISLLKLCTRH